MTSFRSSQIFWNSSPLRILHGAAFMNAQNDFVDLNLDASGSTNVHVHGIMSAGNQVAIDRDYVHGDGSVSHSQLRVSYDDRMATGALELPGLPSWEAKGGGCEVVAWREVGE